MYALFTLLAGACQSAMGSLNRMLTDYVGMFGMSLVVHAVGGILLILYMKLFVRKIKNLRNAMVSLYCRILRDFSGCDFQLLYRNPGRFCHDLPF